MLLPLIKPKSWPLRDNQLLVCRKCKKKINKKCLAKFEAALRCCGSVRVLCSLALCKVTAFGGELTDLDQVDDSILAQTCSNDVWRHEIFEESCHLSPYASFFKITSVN